MDIQEAGKDPSALVGAASIASIASVRGKLLFFYVFSKLRSPADVAWTRKTAKDLREAVTQANKE